MPLDTLQVILGTREYALRLLCYCLAAQ